MIDELIRLRVGSSVDVAGAAHDCLNIGGQFDRLKVGRKGLAETIEYRKQCAMRYPLRSPLQGWSQMAV